MSIASDASVHPRTVTEFSEGQHRPRRRRSPPRHLALATWAHDVHPLVWSTALRLCDGEPSRIEVRSSSEVVVHNDPSWRSSS